jgi:hypothetical protein
MILSSLLAVAVVVALLIGAIGFAQRRSRDATGTSEQSRRIPIPIAAFTIGLTLFGCLSLVGRAGPSDLIGLAILLVLFYGTGCMVLVCALDLACMKLRARRTRGWLLVGIAVLTCGGALAVLGPAGLLTGREFVVGMTPELAAMCALCIAAALIWWSFLPVERPVATVFE